MSRLHTRALAAVAVLLLGLLIIWLASQLQPYEDVVEHGPAPESCEGFIQRRLPRPSLFLGSCGGLSAGESERAGFGTAAACARHRS